MTRRAENGSRGKRNSTSPPNPPLSRCHQQACAQFLTLYFFWVIFASLASPSCSHFADGGICRLGTEKRNSIKKLLRDLEVESKGGKPAAGGEANMAAGELVRNGADSIGAKGGAEAEAESKMGYDEDLRVVVEHSQVVAHAWIGGPDADGAVQVVVAQAWADEAVGGEVTMDDHDDQELEKEDRAMVLESDLDSNFGAGLMELEADGARESPVVGLGECVNGGVDEGTQEEPVCGHADLETEDDDEETDDDVGGQRSGVGKSRLGCPAEGGDEEKKRIPPPAAKRQKQCAAFVCGK